MTGTTLVAAIIIVVAVIAMLGGILIATTAEDKIAGSGFRRFVTHRVTVAATAALATGCLVGVVVLGFFTFAPNVIPNVTASSAVPQLAAAYNGNLTNTTVNQGATMALQSIQQHGSDISGYFQVGAPLAGSGNFTGTVDTHRHITFDVKSTAGGVSFDIQFTGTVASDGSISGAYTVHYQNGDQDQQGTWSVRPS